MTGTDEQADPAPPSPRSVRNNVDLAQEWEWDQACEALADLLSSPDEGEVRARLAGRGILPILLGAIGVSWENADRDAHPMLPILHAVRASLDGWLDVSRNAPVVHVPRVEVLLLARKLTAALALYQISDLVTTAAHPRGGRR